MNQTTPIITLTHAAINYIKKFSDHDHAKKVFRLAIKKTGCSGYSYIPSMVEKPEATDIQHEQDGQLISIEANSVNYLKGTIVDLVKKDLGQQQWLFKNPNVAAECGCGESFSVKDAQTSE